MLQKCRRKQQCPRQNWHCQNWCHAWSVTAVFHHCKHTTTNLSLPTTSTPPLPPPSDFSRMQGGGQSPQAWPMPSDERPSKASTRWASGRYSSATAGSGASGIWRDPPTVDVVALTSEERMVRADVAWGLPQDTSPPQGGAIDLPSPPQWWSFAGRLGAMGATTG